MSDTLDKDVISILELTKGAPEDFVAETIDSVSQLLEFLPRVTDVEGIEVYWFVWHRTLSAAVSKGTGEVKPEAKMWASTSSVPSRLTEALFEWIRQRSSNSKHEPPVHFWDRLKAVCDSPAETGRWSRSLASRHLSWLFAKNSEWVRVTLLPFFDWGHADEAKAVWQGFLLQPNLTPNLWALLQPSFLATFDNCDKLAPESLRSLYELFARIVVHSPEWLTADECQRIVVRASHEGRQQIAWVFWRNLEASEDKASSLWKERIGPWLTTCWQPDEAMKDAATSESLLRIVLAVGEAFPEAVGTVEHRMTALGNADNAIFELSRTNVPEKFPEDTLKLLDLAIDRGQQFYKGDLRRLLARISEIWPDATKSELFLDLSNFAAA